MSWAGGADESMVIEAHMLTDLHEPDLHGSLEDLSLPELFQLLALTKRSGVVRFSAPAEAIVWVQHGQPVFGTSPGAPSPRELLVRQGIVNGASFDEAMRVTGADRSVTENLVDLFAADGARIAAVATEQIYTTMFEVVVVGAESFEFFRDVADPLGVAVSHEADAVLQEAERRRIQWQRIAELIPSTGLITALSAEIPNGRSGITVTADEWQVLAKLDGHRTIAEVIAALGQSAFEVCGVLYELLRAGTVTVVDDDGSPDNLATQ